MQKLKAKIYQVGGLWFAKLTRADGRTSLGPGRPTQVDAYEALRTQLKLGRLSVMPPAKVRPEQVAA